MNKHLIYPRIGAVLLSAVMLLAMAACGKPAADSTQQTQAAQKQKESNKGKYVSILGDSISTYQGISNVGSVNTTIEGYNVYYNGDWQNAFSSTTETYWGNVIAKHGMKLLVNNSCGGNQLIRTSGSGAGVDAGYIRVENLAANTGELNGTKPDLIFIHMGTNDYIGCVDPGELTQDTYAGVISGDGYISPSTFTEAYIITLDKATKLYPDARIYIFTLPPNASRTDPEALHTYNTRIRELADHYENVFLVDVAGKSGITADNYTAYTLDGLHPNQAGMVKIATILDWAITSSS